MPEEIRIVGLLPDEDQVGGGHEVGPEGAGARRTWKRIRAHADPTAVVRAVVLRPELLVGEQLFVEKAASARLVEAALLHGERLAARIRAKERRG